MPEILRVVSVSGGKDSTAMYLWALEQWGRRGFVAVFADTGHEHPVTLNYVRNLHSMAKGPKVHWVRADFTEKLRGRGLRASGNPFLDMLLWKGMMPSGRRQFCTTHLKLEPIRDWLENNRGDAEVFLYVGIRAEESERRSKLSAREFSDYYDCEIERPLLHWKKADVFAILERHAVPANPLYAHGMSRVGCLPCINANKGDLAVLPAWAWDKIRRWEKRLGLPWFKPGLISGRGEVTISEVRKWSRTKWGGKELDPFAKPDAADVPTCMSTWGTCE